MKLSRLNIQKTGKEMPLPKPKLKRLVTRMGGTDLLRRKKSELSHRPCIDVHSELLEEVTQRASIKADSGVITHQTRLFDVMYCMHQT